MIVLDFLSIEGVLLCLVLSNALSLSSSIEIEVAYISYFVSVTNDRLVKFRS